MVMSGILHANEKLNKMKLKLDEHQLDYLTMIIEQNMEDCEIIIYSIDPYGNGLIEVEEFNKIF